MNNNREAKGAKGRRIIDTSRTQPILPRPVPHRDIQRTQLTSPRWVAWGITAAGSETPNSL